MNITIEGNVQEGIDRLGTLADRKNVRKIRKALVLTAAKGGEKVGKKSLRASGVKSSSDLYKAVKGAAGKRDKESAAIYPRGSGAFLKGMIREQGVIRRAKTRRNMIFQIDGKWIRKSLVSQRPRPWAGAIGVYLQSGKLAQDLQVRLEKEVNKIFEKQGVGL